MSCFTTLRLGEEEFQTTLAVGEEGPEDVIKPCATTLAVGEEGPTTLRIGEEDFDPSLAPAEPFGTF